jgi:hypothetical protein
LNVYSPALVCPGAGSSTLSAAAERVSAQSALPTHALDTVTETSTAALETSPAAM